jgi:hypothetical protein
MATGRIGTNTVLTTRWSKAPAGGTTSLSGLDDNSVSLVYSVGYEQVYLNGALLSRGGDYTATNGTTITLTNATVAGDIVEVFANELIPLTDAISKGQFTAKGSLLSASAASTPAVLSVGTNNQVLTADSSTSTGLKWATPSSGSMTLLSTTSLTGSSVSINAISGSYKNLYVEWEGVYCSATASMRLRPNGVTSGIYYDTTKSNQTSALATSTSVSLALDIPSTSGTQNWGYFYINDYADGDHWKFIDNYSVVESTDGATYVRVFPSYGYWRATTAITSLTFLLSTGTFSGGTVRVYGVN